MSKNGDKQTNIFFVLHPPRPPKGPSLELGIQHEFWQLFAYEFIKNIVEEKITTLGEILPMVSGKSTTKETIN